MTNVEVISILILSIPSIFIMGALASLTFDIGPTKLFFMIKDKELGNHIRRKTLKKGDDVYVKLIDGSLYKGYILHAYPHTNEYHVTDGSKNKAGNFHGISVPLQKLVHPKSLKAAEKVLYGIK